MLDRPSPSLTDGTITLAPLTQADAEPMQLLASEPDVARFTLVPTNPEPDFAATWIERYEAGWRDGSCAGFSIRDRAAGSFLGFASVVRLDLPALQGELGYIVVPAARGRGLAIRSVSLLTHWCFDALGLRRVELRIDSQNVPSARVAERSGYQREGVLRDLHFKEGLRCDVEVWSRLSERGAPSR